MWKRSFALLPGIGVSLLPKLICPMFACLCGPCFSARPGLSDFYEVFAAVDGYFSRRHSYGARFSRFTTSRLRPVVAGPCRGGGGSNREVLFRRSASDLWGSRAADRCIGLE